MTRWAAPLVLTRALLVNGVRVMREKQEAAA